MKEEKFAVIYTAAIYHAGDERSRTNPGHGYPSHTEHINKIETFKDEDALKHWIAKNSKKSYKAIRYEELNVVLNLEVKLT